MNKMHWSHGGRVWLTAALLGLTTGLMAQPKDHFWLGADISGTTALEHQGVQLYNTLGEPRENTQLMKEYGLDAVRLRVWVNPKDGFCSPEDVLTMARRAKALGMAIMIDFHYSDWWADPGQQNPPAAWKKMNFKKMTRALADHTGQTLKRLKDNGIDVRWIQIGNETTHGFLWPMARAEKNMKHYALMTEAGYQAAKHYYPDATVIVHLDGGCDPQRYHFIFDGLKKYGTHWDMIGMSVYSYWDRDAHLQTSTAGTIRDVVANIKQLAKDYGTDVMCVETGTEVKKPVEGKAEMAWLIRALRDSTDGHCHGVFYWAPELEGQYPLGAFENHRPTAIMDAFSEASPRINAPIQTRVYSDSIDADDRCVTSVRIEAPVNGTPALRDSLFRWFAKTLNGDIMEEDSLLAASAADREEPDNVEALVKTYVTTYQQELLPWLQASLDYIAQWKKDYRKKGKAWIEKNAPNEPHYLHQANFVKVADTDAYVSYLFDSYWYLNGAHGSSLSLGATFSKRDGHRLVYPMTPERWHQLQPTVRQKLAEYFDQGDTGNTITTDNLNDYLLLEDTKGDIPYPAYAPYYSDNGDVVLIYQQYEIASYAAGMPSFTLPIK